MSSTVYASLVRFKSTALRLTWSCFERAASGVSGEWLLKKRANGGTVIVARALLSATWLYLVAIGLRSRLDPASTWKPDLVEFLREARDILPWFGALFAGSYAGLYGRFSSQWSYLAEFYNQIMVAQIQCPVTPQNQDAYTKWFVAFIEDAESLHLALKPTFASVIRSLLAKPGVEAAYASSGSDAEEELADLKANIQRILSSN